MKGSKVLPLLKEENILIITNASKNKINGLAIFFICSSSFQIQANLFL
jgi:hypothetical protein